jgi:hypothetical protein
MTREYYVTEENGQRAIVCEKTKKKIRIQTEEGIFKMSTGSLKMYKQKVIKHHGDIHNHGTPQAVKSVDYLRHTINRELSKRVNHV